MNKVLDKRKFNKYDYGVIAIIGLLIFGGIGGAFQPVRILGLVFSPYVYYRLFSGKTTKNQQWVFVFFIFWLLYSVLTFLWTPNKIEGMKVLVYFYVHFSLFFLLVFWAQKANSPLKAILGGWVLVLILTIPIALYEIITYQHLPISRYGSDKLINLGGNIIRQRFASVTFLNSNTYVVIVVFCLPFLYGKMIYVNKFFQQVILWILLMLSTIILVVNASRGGILCVSIISLTFLFFVFKGKQFKIRNIVILSLGILITLSVFTVYSDVIFRHFSYRINEGGGFLEDNARLYLYGLALKLLADSLFLGTGIGSEQAALASISTGITANHNLFLEVLMQYGIIVFIFFFIFIYKIFSKLRKIKVRLIRFILYSFLLAFIPLFIINSGYLLMPSVWLLFSSLFVLGTEQKIISCQNIYN